MPESDSKSDGKAFRTCSRALAKWPLCTAQEPNFLPRSDIIILFSGLGAAARPHFWPGLTSGLPARNGGDCSDRRLHCEDGAEPGLALHNALVGLRSLGQWVRLDYRFNFSLRYEIKGFVEIFGAVLLAANDTNALRDEVDQTKSKAAPRRRPS